MLESKLAVIQLTTHKAELPSDLKYLIQVAYRNTPIVCTDCINELNLPENSDLGERLNIITRVKWSPMRLTTNPYHQSLCLNDSILNCQYCHHEFSVSNELILTSTLKEGTLMVAYIGLPTNSDGKLLIPNNEEVKEAILNYVLFRYWSAKYNMMEDGSDSRMKFYQSQWHMYKLKAQGNLNLPDTNEMENLMSQFNKIIPRENRFEQMFITLNNRESASF